MIGFMIMATEDKQWLTVTEAVELMGCTDGWVRMLLRTGQLQGQKFGPRSWMVSRASALEQKKELTSRAVGQREQAKKPQKARKRQG